MTVHVEGGQSMRIDLFLLGEDRAITSGSLFDLAHLTSTLVFLMV
jgi:hypothetical protein